MNAIPDRRKLFLLIAGITLARIIWATATPLISGEAYYWLWNWHPAAGYFDHPPMVGLISYALGGRILGSTLAARLQPIVLAVFSTLAIYGLAKSMFPNSRTPWLAALLFTLAPILDLNGMFLTPDNSLVLFTALTWLLFWRAAEQPAHLILWFAAGIAAGLALLSKFHAWVLLPPLYLFLLLSQAHRRQLATAGPWLALLAALLVLSPNLFWNARHEWLNYAFQWRRSGLPEAEFEPKFVANYLLGPLGTLSPLIYIAMIAGAWRGFRLWRVSKDPRWLYLLCAGLPLPVFLLLLTPRTQISLHWPAPAYGALLVLVAALQQSGRLFSPRLFRAALTVMFAFTALLHVSPFLIPILPAKARAKEKALGWNEIGQLARRHREEMLGENPQTPVVLMAPNWHLTSSLLFYAQLPGEGSPLNEPDLHNYLLWNAPKGMLRGYDAVVVIEKENPHTRHSKLEKKYDKYHRMLDPLFEKVEERPSLLVYPDGGTEEYYGVSIEPRRLREFLIFRATGFKGEFFKSGEESN